MKEIKLLNLTISNWRGQNHNIDFKDNTFISAKNGAGKSTLLHAWLWALTGYTEVGLPKNTNLFDNREALSEHTPWASVVATMEIDGYKYVVERKSKPKFTRSKGSLEFTKGSSDLYEYYIDNIEVGASGITNFVEGTIGVPCDMLVYCLSGDFFSYLASEEKNKARNILCSIAGEVKPEDFKGDYSSIAEMLRRYSASEIIEMSRKKKKPLEERQNVIPVEIDRKEERLAELKAMDFTATEREIEKIKGEIEAIDGLLLGNADAVKPILEHNREIENKVSNKRLLLANGRLDYKEEQNARTSEIKAKIAEVKRFNEGVHKENDKRKREWEEDIETKEVYERKLSRLTAKREELLKRRDEVKGRVYAEEACAYCGQELPYEMLEKARAKFNETKAKDLELIVAEGKEVAKEITKTKEKIESIGKRIEAGYTSLEWQDLTPYEKALARVEATFVPYEETDEFKQINAEIEALMSEIKEVPSNDNESLTSRKKALIENLSELSKKLGLKDEIAKVEKDIVELREELRSVANSIAEIEGHIYSAQAWLQERNEIVSFRINEKLEYSKIEMFATQKNGEVVPDCRLVNKKGVSYGVTNNADKGAIDTDLQKLFMRHYDIALPIFVDEASIYDSEHLPKDDNYQFVYLFASDSPILIVE